MTNEIFSRIAERDERDRLAAETEWQATVEKLAKDEDVVERDVLTAMKLTGRSLEDLAKSVEWQKHILALRATLAEWPEVERLAQLAHKTETEFQLRRQEHERQMVAECREITVASQFAAAERDRIVSAKNELASLLNEPVMLPEVAEVVS